MAHVLEGDTRFATRLRSEFEPDHDLVAHALVSRGDVLISYASVLRAAVASLRERQVVFGARSVYAFPSFRGEGAGQTVVAAAEAFMRQQSADAGMLFCGPEMEVFYSGLGWETASGPTFVGSRERPDVRPRVRMARLLSTGAEAERAALLNDALYIGSKAW